MRSNLESVPSNAIAPPNQSSTLKVKAGIQLSPSLIQQVSTDSSSITCFCHNSNCHYQHPVQVTQDLANDPPLTTSIDEPTPQLASSTVTIPEFIPSTGFDAIDGLLGSRKWADPTITFSFPDAFELDYAADYPRYISHATSFRQAPTGLQTVVRHWFSEISSIVNLTFIELEGPEDSATEDEEALLRIAMSNDPGSAYAYSPWASDEAADVWFNNETYGAWFDQAKMGEYAWHTIGHELSHALGLKHGHEGGGVSGVALPLEQDSMEFSIMTYRSYENQTVTGAYANAYGNYAQTLMMLDIQALQSLYGANYDTHSGDTTYSFSPTTGELFIDGISQGQPVLNTIFRTIWDGNGVDTYDFSNYKTSLNIDLTPGGYVDLDQKGNEQRALLGQNEQIYARGHVFNSLLFDNDPRSLIENTIGGANRDHIQGNIADNRLEGGRGNDTIDGDDGADTLVDGPGKDTLTGGEDADRFILDADSKRDRITDFIPGTDQLDLSAWGITDINQLQITVNPNNLKLVFEQETLILDQVDDTLFDVTAIVGVPTPDTSGSNISRSDDNDQDDGTQAALHNPGTEEQFETNTDDAELIEESAIDTDLDMTVGNVSTTDQEQGQNSDTPDTIPSDPPTGSISGQVRHDKASNQTGTSTHDQMQGTDMAEQFYGGGGDDAIFGEGGNDDMWGQQGNDHLRGGADDDKLRGEEGNDLLQGNHGDDLLKGTSMRLRGAYEQDVYRGGPGKDQFVIGNRKYPYYVADGQQDYALLTDFTPGQDTIVLHGSAHLYRTTQDSSHTLLWLEAPEGSSAELVASFAQTSHLRLESNSFRYV